MRLLTLILTLAMLSTGIARADISYGTAGVVVGQNFNNLLTSGTNNSWTNDLTLPGWYSDRTSYRAGTGSGTQGDLYSFGIAGVNPVTDRGLGSVASNGTGTIRTGIAFVNNTGTTLNTISIRYTGEQWRNGGNTTQHSLTFDWKKNTGPIAIGDSGFTSVTAMNFTGPIATATAGALDGNVAANRVNGINVQLSGVSWAAGQTLFLRWSDLNDLNDDHGLAIDDFYFAATVPEPGSIALLAGMGIVGAFVARRRMVAKRKRI